MSKVKKSWITIISLFAALFLILGLAVSMPKVSVFASTYAPSSVFSAGTGGSVGASDAGEEENAESFVEFTFANGGKVHFRRDLALKWYEGKGDVKYFSMQFSFGEINFEKFTIDFESAEENISKDGKTTNSIVFTKNADGNKLDVSVNGAASAASVDKSKDVRISFNEDGCEIGEFNVVVANVETAAEENGGETASLSETVTNEAIAGKFENIGGYFMEYRSSSSSTPNTPITFKADFPDGTTDSTLRQTVLMKSLNGQNFKLNNGRVEDNAPAVLVLNEQVFAFKLGQKFSLSYEAIDVCDDNVTVSREYYMLKKDGEANIMPNDKELKGEGKEKYETYNYKTLTTSTYFLPSQENKDQKEYVAIRFKLDDDTDENDTYVYLSWYATGKALQSFECTGYEEVENDGKKEVQKTNGSFDFIKVDREKEGPKYTVLKADEATSENTFEDADDAVGAYQAALNDAASYELSETSAGSGAYIYLPSFRNLIGSEYAGYRNLKFSIYYYKPSQGADATASSQVNLKYNELRLEITEKGVYKFRVLAQDASGNAMQYYLNKELVTVTSSNIWDIEGIPEFTFEIDYKGPTIEEMEEQTLGYRNDTYNFTNFDVVALAGYRTEYTLYRYNSANIPEGVTAPSSYADFVENAEEYFKTFKAIDDAEADQSKKILYEISVFQEDVTKDDEAKWNRTDNDYYWDPDSSLSFSPQEAGFYVLKLLVEDNVLPGKTAEAFQVVEVRNPIDTIPGQSQWLEENVVSVVLFAISGVLAIIVVVLFLVKPNEKKLEEVDLEKLKGKKKDKKK